MTLLVQLRLQVRGLQARVDALEAALAARPARRKRERAPRPADAVIAAREALWAKYVMLEMQHGNGRVKLTKLSFAVHYRLNPDEFCRWFSPTDRRGVPAGSGPDVRFRRALADAIAELETRGKKTTDRISGFSRDKIASSQDSSAHLH